MTADDGFRDAVPNERRGGTERGRDEWSGRSASSNVRPVCGPTSRRDWPTDTSTERPTRSRRLSWSGEPRIAWDAEC